jgi:hypothetical protein
MGGLCRSEYQLKIFTRLSLVLNLAQERHHCGILITTKPHYGVGTTEMKPVQGRGKFGLVGNNIGGTIVLPLRATQRSENPAFNGPTRAEFDFS